uniref:Thioesterase domain-containing protein n=1 Tax=Oryza brachyantha TaxID=4533 RepID=J3KXY4_ORYBR
MGSSISRSQSKRQCAAARRPNQSRLRMGGPATPPSRMAAGARKWLEEAGVAFDGSDRRAFNALPLTGVRVSLAEGGRAVCSLRVPAELTDAEGNWHPGAIAAAADDVCAAAIMSVEGIIKVSVHYDISYFSPAKYHEEVELDGRVVEQKGKMTAVTVEIRKKDSGELVAIGRQWMSTTRPKEPQASSKL